MSHGLVGSSLEHYRLDAPLGAGAMSEVYLATDTALGKKVAVKVIHPSAALNPEQVTRFEREARAAARLQHPHVAVVYFAGTTTFAAPFYAMELIEGWSMDELIEARMRFRLEQALALFAQACSGLDAASKAGIFHRDIKPANLMVGRDGILKVVDFGLAKLNDDASLTQSGTMMGTPTYMAPEIARGTGGDFRSDIYSLGVTFFHMLAGFPPFEADTTYGVLLKHIQDEPPLLREVNTRLPERLTSLVQRMLAKIPEARPTSHAQVHYELLGIAAELDGAAGTNPQLAYCTNEERVTVAAGARCTECGEAYASYRRPERLHVDIVGWNRNDGRDAVALHIGKQVAQAAVARQLEVLPYRAAQRVPRNRARELQRTLFELGADVQLVAADASGREGDPGKRPALPRKVLWPPPPRIGAGEGAGATVSEPATQSRMKSALGRVERPSGVNLFLVAAVVVLAGLLLRERFSKAPEAPPPEAAPVEAEEEAPLEARAAATPAPRVAPAEDPAPTPAEAPVEEAEPEVTEVPTEVEAAADEERPESRWFRTTDTGLDAAVASAALGALDDAAEELGAALGLRPRDLSARLSAEPLDGSGRAWTEAPYSPEIVFPAGGARDDAAALRAAARGLVTRAATSEVAGDRAPPWFVVGLSLYAEQGPTTVDENAAVIAADTLFPTRLLAGTQRNDAPTERALRSFSGFLVEQYGWDKVSLFARRLGRGASPDDAGREAFAGPLSELELAWQDACGLE